MESLGPIFFLPRCRWMPLGSWVISFASPKSVFWCWWLVDLVVWLEGYVIYAYIYYHSRMQRRTPKKIGWSTSSSNFRHIHHKSQFFLVADQLTYLAGPSKCGGIQPLGSLRKALLRACVSRYRIRASCERGAADFVAPWMARKREVFHVHVIVIKASNINKHHGFSWGYTLW
jgi:hypothetical protein